MTKPELGMVDEIVVRNPPVVGGESTNDGQPDGLKLGNNSLDDGISIPYGL